MLALRNYQEKIVSGVREVYLQGYRAPLAVAPTGAGKTVIFSYIANNTTRKNKRVLILVHRIELLRQTSSKLREFGVDHGLVNPKYTPSYHWPVQVASVQTIIKRLHKIEPPDLIIIDEAHHATAGSWRKIIDTFPNARILGVTATPCRTDGTGLGQAAGGVFDCMVMGPQIKELIEAGYLVAPKVYAPMERLDLSKIHTRMGDYNSSELEVALDKPKITGFAVQHYKQLCDGAPAVAFCVSRKHAQHVADEFRAAGYVAYAVDGDMEDDTRKRILGGLATGKVHLVASCDLISEGTDIPAIGCAILLRPTKSQGLFLQQVGRALRPAEGKDHAIILDHVGNVLIHGMPEDNRDWTLDGEEKRGRAKLEAGIKIEQCPQCFHMHPPTPECPECGHIKPVEDVAPPAQEDGLLTEMTVENKAILKQLRETEVANARTREELMAIAKRRGYRPGWVNHIIRDRERKKAMQRVDTFGQEVI